MLPNAAHIPVNRAAGERGERGFVDPGGLRRGFQRVGVGWDFRARAMRAGGRAALAVGFPDPRHVLCRRLGFVTRRADRPTVRQRGRATECAWQNVVVFRPPSAERQAAHFAFAIGALRGLVADLCGKFEALGHTARTIVSSKTAALCDTSDTLGNRSPTSQPSARAIAKSVPMRTPLSRTAFSIDHMYSFGV